MLQARLTTQEDIDAGLPTYDYSMLNAVATCPTYGLTRYIANKVPESGGDREMALEAGQVIHDCMAAMSLYQLEVEGFPEHAYHHRKRLFDVTRIPDIFDNITKKESTATQLRGICERTIATSGFYDNNDDPKRSISVIEDTLAAYINRHPWTTKPTWIRDRADPTSDVGIEMNADMVVNVPRRDGSFTAIRYIGRLDRLQWEDDENIGGIDYKTTSMNMTDAWDSGFILSPQVTGYCVYASLFTGEPVWRFTIHGLRLPVPAKTPYNGIKFLPLQRGETHVDQWLQWISWCLDTIQEYGHAPQNAPKFNHACNRFFRPCSYLYMCDGDAEWRKDTFNSMETKVWNPHD